MQAGAEGRQWLLSINPPGDHSVQLLPLPSQQPSNKWKTAALSLGFNTLRRYSMTRVRSRTACSSWSALSWAVKMLNWIETLEYNIKDAENLVGAFSKENIREKVSLFQLGRVSFQSVDIQWFPIFSITVEFVHSRPINSHFDLTLVRQVARKKILLLFSSLSRGPIRRDDIVLVGKLNGPLCIIKKSLVCLDLERSVQCCTAV